MQAGNLNAAYRLWLSIRLAHRGCCAPTRPSKPPGFAGGGKQAEGDLGAFLDGANCCSAGVRYWHSADIPRCTLHVRFRGQTRHKAHARIAMPPRRFPAPWTFEDHNDACFIVKDANGMRRLLLRHLYVW
jgi:hypothetical protein